MWRFHRFAEGSKPLKIQTQYRWVALNSKLTWVIFFRIIHIQTKRDPPVHLCFFRRSRWWFLSYILSLFTIIYSSNDPGLPPNSLFPYILPHTAMPTIHLTWPSTFAPTLTPRPNLPHHLTTSSLQSNTFWYLALDKTRLTASMLYHNKPRQRYSLAFLLLLTSQKNRTQRYNTTNVSISSQNLWFARLITASIRSKIWWGHDLKFLLDVESRSSFEF